MNLNDLSRLKVLMVRTTSHDDAESLMALRAANDLLKRNGLDWTKVLSRTVSVSLEPGSRPRVPISRVAEIEGLFAELDKINMEFVTDVREEYDRTGNLTDRQIEALKRIADRL